MSREWSYVPGGWWLVCDVCGKKMKASNSRHRWDGLIVCDADFEHRHAQDFIKVRQDKISVPFTRPRPEDVFVEVAYIEGTLTCTPLGRTAVVGFAVAGCAQSGFELMGVL